MKKLFTRPDFEFLTVKLQLKITDPNTGHENEAKVFFVCFKLVLNPNVFLKQKKDSGCLNKKYYVETISFPEARSFTQTAKRYVHMSICCFQQIEFVS